MVDTGDLKSLGSNAVRVRLPPRANFWKKFARGGSKKFCFRREVEVSDVQVTNRPGGDSRLEQLKHNDLDQTRSKSFL